MDARVTLEKRRQAAALQKGRREWDGIRHRRSGGTEYKEIRI